MNERLQDCELLRAFVRQGDQAAFGAVVRRHLDLVFATALRKLEDPGAAEEVAFVPRQRLVRTVRKSR